MSYLTHLGHKDTTYTSSIAIVVRLGQDSLMEHIPFHPLVLNSDFSFSWTGCYLMAREPTMPWYLTDSQKKMDSCLWEKVNKTESSRNWTQYAKFTPWFDNFYNICTSNIYVYLQFNYKLKIFWVDIHKRMWLIGQLEKKKDILVFYILQGPL